MSWRNAIGVALLLTALAGSWWLARTPTEPPGVGPGGRTTAGYYLRNASIVQMGEDGQALYELRAEEIVEDSAANTIALHGVQVDYAFPDTNWSLQAAHGHIAGDERIELEGNVRATGVEIVGQDTAVILTDSLSLDVQDYVASTQDPVRIELAGHEIMSKGLRAHLKDNRLELQSEVHGRFTPR